ncbi:hypothetical protein RHGRI_020342 [Rhododendron griersonianum]|uniref:Lipoyl-binding domain-containing protein n=1 Tax=Rhododendron griersonianum TaxID=479676 RepID=A0AAV6JFW0_9ERIC|nr:hypothetical protein RHGRI_020342 [Rhododendron griersonianum]
MALRIWASSTANALGVSCASKSHLSPPFSLSRCFSTVLEGLKYASSHEWVKVDGSVATIGITDHAQVPELGGPVTQGSSFGAVESVKATSDVNSPISGEIVEVNSKLTESPGLDHLREVVFVEVPKPGGSVAQGSSFGAVESVKATSDVNSPISSAIVEVN